MLNYGATSYLYFYYFINIQNNTKKTVIKAEVVTSEISETDRFVFFVKNCVVIS